MHTYTYVLHKNQKGKTQRLKQVTPAEYARKKELLKSWLPQIEATPQIPKESNKGKAHWFH